jgi:hypothetical protein
MRVAEQIPHVLRLADARRAKFGMAIFGRDSGDDIGTSRNREIGTSAIGNPDNLKP